MKSSKWALIKKAFMFASLTFVIAATVACDPTKKSSGSSVSSRQRNFTPQGTMTNVSGMTGQQQLASWGVVQHSGQGTLQYFMNLGPDALGQVSQNPNDPNTGIRFRGSVSSGRLDMLVWDDRATSEGAFYWSMSIDKSYSGKLQDGTYQIVARDGVGFVQFIGQISGNSWQGQIRFNNQDGNADQILGNFSIPANAIW